MENENIKEVTKYCQCISHNIVYVVEYAESGGTATECIQSHCSHDAADGADDKGQWKANHSKSDVPCGYIEVD